MAAETYLTESSTAEGAAPESAAPVSDVAPATPSTAETGVETTLLDAVSAALDKGSEAPPASEVGQGKPDPTTTTDPADKPADPKEGLTDEDRKLMSARTQTRFQQLLDGRREATEKATAFEKELNELRPKAQLSDRIVGFMHQHGIEGREVDNTLEITRLIKSGDHERAYQALTPIYEELKKRVGEVLPPQLEEQVRLGYITKAHAQALHKAQTKVAVTEVQSRQMQQRQAVEQQNRQREALVSEGMQALDQWYSAKAQSDPDFKTKQDDVAAEFELLVRRQGSIPTKAQAVQLAEQAFSTVNERVKRFAPKPSAVRTPTGQFASSRSVTAPRTHLEAIEQALNGVGR